MVGGSEARVRECRLQLELLMSHARRRMPPTHFLSLPLACQQLTDAFTVFKVQTGTAPAVRYYRVIEGAQTLTICESNEDGGCEKCVEGE